MAPSMVFLVAVLVAILSSSFAYGDNNPSAYVVLQEYDFPIGLLPKGVTGYELDKESGNFKVYFDGTCRFSIENSYNLRYKSTITGVLSKGRLKNLNGVSVKILLFWFNIVEVIRDGDELQFSVVIASADFSIDNFEESPRCGCGFACKSRASSTIKHLIETMSPKATLLPSLILFFLLSFLIPSSFAADELTVYEALEEYDFPVGILPKDVVSYELDTSTGKFSVYLNSTCRFTIDSYKLKYKSTITGIVTTGKISSLSGIEVRVLFLWLSIVSVTRDDDELELSVGIASANFPVSNFDESPTCGCGFDCVNGKRMIKNLVSALLGQSLAF
ncbi:hypothetical protein ACFX2C_031385 [Malus domestica]